MATFGPNGEVLIPVGLDTSDVQADAKAIRKKVEEAFPSDALQQQNKQLQHIAQSMKQTYNQSIELSEALEQVKNTPVPTEEYQQLTRTIMESGIEAEKLLTIQQELESKGIGPGNETYDKITTRIEELKQTLIDCTEQAEELEQTGKAFTIDTEKADELEKKLGVVNDKLKVQLGNCNDIVNKQEQHKVHLDKIKSVLGSIAAGFKNIGTHIKSGLSHLMKWPTLLKSIASHAKSAKTSISNIAKGILQATLKIGSVVMLIRTLTSYAKEGFSNLAKEGRAAANSISSLGSGAASNLQYVADSSIQAASSLNILSAKFMQLKNSIGAAIAPLVNMVVPVISRIIDLFTRAFNAVAMFFGALTGKKSVQVAKTLGEAEGAVLNADKSGGSGSNKKTAEQKYQEAVEKAQARYEKELAKYNEKVAKAQEKQAKAEDKQAKAAAKLAKEQEKVNKQLQGFDELNNLTTNEIDDNLDAIDDYEDYLAGLEPPELELPDRDDFIDALGGGGAGGLSDMFEEAEIPSMFEDLVDWLKDMWEKADFTELGKKAGEALKKFLDDVPWDKIQEYAAKVGKSLATLANGFLRVEGLGYSIGNTFAQALNTLFTTLSNFVTNFDWKALGHFVADGLNGLFDNINWELIKTTFVEGFRGLATSINTFVQDFKWDNVSEAIANIVNIAAETAHTFFSETNFKELARKIGEQIGETLKKINWEEVGAALGSMVQSLIDFIAGLIEGLGETEWADIKEALQNFWKGLSESLDLSESGERIASILVTAIAVKLLTGVGPLNLLYAGIKSIFTGATATAAAEAGGFSLAAIFVSALAGGIAGGKISETKFGELFQTAGKAQGFADQVVLFGKWATEGNAVAQAMEQIDKGYVYTTEDLKEMQEEYGLSEANVKKLENAMWNVNDELTDFRSKIEFMSGNEGMFSDMNAGDLLVIKNVLDEIGNGYVTNQQQLDNWFAKYERTTGRTVELSQEQEQFLLSNLGKYNSGLEKTQEEYDHIGLKMDAYRETQKGVAGELDKTRNKFTESAIKIQEAADTSTTFGDNIMQVKDKSTQAAEGVETMSQTFQSSTDGLKEIVPKWGEVGTESADTLVDDFVTESSTRQSDINAEGTNALAGYQLAAQTKGKETSTWFGTFFQGLIDKVRSIFQSHSPSVVMQNIGIDVFTGLWNGFKSMGDKIMSWISNFIQSIVDAFSNLGQSISDTISGWKDSLDNFSLSGAISNIGGRISNKIHGYAGGQVIPPNMAAHLAVLGDNNRETEVVSPLSTMKEAMIEALATANISNNGSNAPIVVQIDGREVFRAVRDQNDIYYNQTGLSAFA